MGWCKIVSMKSVRSIGVLLVALVSMVVHAQGASQANDKAALATMQKTYASTKAAYTKKPSNAAAKKAYVNATVKLGTATMMTATLPPREKYSGALKYYREALKVDPKNAEALKNKKLIEDIYRSMGRPIPK